MKAKLTLFFLLNFLLMATPSLQVYGQKPGKYVKRETCEDCGKTLQKCKYKGKHPKCQTCGKLKEQCPYNGNHPKPQPQPTTGTLSITSTPSDVSVKINGEYIGNTPLTLKNCKAGTYEVTFSAEGYETTTKSVTVTAGKTATCSASLNKKQAPQPVVQQPVEQQPVEQQPVQQPVAQQPDQQLTTLTNSSPASSQTITVGNVSFKMIRVECAPLGTFYIGETEVTQELWEAVMGSNPSNFKGTDRPVEKVNKNDCLRFINRLNAITGKSFRLPTEKEWEFAARGGNKSQGYKYSGSNSLDEVGWYYENSGIKRLNEISWTLGKLERNSCCTHPVKEKKPNELGIYDMSGNVWEWCEESSRSYSVMRGGSWQNGASALRVKNRIENMSSLVDESIGLRLAL